MPNKFKNLFNKILNQSINVNNKFIFIIFIYNSIVLILLNILNIYVSAELLTKIDD